MFLSLHLCFSCVFPESTLTPENLSTVLDSMHDALWLSFGGYMNIPLSERHKIGRQSVILSELKKAVIPHIVSTHPALSWRLVANALYQMGPWKGGHSCHRALAYLQQLFPTGNTHCN